MIPFVKVSIVDQGDSSNQLLTTKVTNWLRTNGIFVADVIAYDHSMLYSVLEKSESQVVVSLVSNDIMSELVRSHPELGKLASMKKVWFTLQLNDANEGDDMSDFLPEGKAESSSLQVQILEILGSMLFISKYLCR
jgi:hypothetical protein